MVADFRKRDENKDYRSKTQWQGEFTFSDHGNENEKWERQANEWKETTDNGEEKMNIVEEKCWCRGKNRK